MPESVTSELPLHIKPVPGSTLTTVLLSVVVIAALYLGREVFVPIALAGLLSFVLAPPVGVLQRWYVPRSVAVIVVGLLAFAAIFGLGAVMVSQLNQLADELPRYQATLREKIQSLRGATTGTGTLERASQVLKDLGKEIDKPRIRSLNAPRGEGLSPDSPIPVEVRLPDPGALESLVALIRPLLYPLTTTGIVAIFVIFILFQRQDLRNRLVRLAGAQDLQRTTAALDDAGQRLSRLFLTQLALNAGFGLVIGLGLWVIGVPSAPLWGMLAMIMRFVPYIGALISAIFPLILAAAVGPDWSMVLWTGALFVIVEPIVGHVIEPMVYGHSAGLSPVAVITAATFWTWLWGPIGLVLATPLTICLVVLGRHVDRLKFLEVMFGDRPPLTPAELIYQRLLARDPVEAAEQAQAYLNDKPLISYYDDILLNGLKLAQADADRGLLDEEHQHRIRDGVAEIIDDLDGHADKSESLPGADANAEAESPLEVLNTAEAAQAVRLLPERWRAGHPVLCIPGSGLLDEAAAMIVAQLVQRLGIGARAELAGALSMSRIFGWDPTGVALVCLCYVENATPAEIRYAIRRIRRRAPDVFIFAVLLGDTERIDRQGASASTDIVEHSLRATLDRILAVASTRPNGRESSEPSTLADTSDHSAPMPSADASMAKIPQPKPGGPSKAETLISSRPLHLSNPKS